MHFGAQAMPRLSKLLNMNLEHGSHSRTAITLDWKGFDYSIPAFLIKDAADILVRSIDFTRMTFRD